MSTAHEDRDEYLKPVNSVDSACRLAAKLLDQHDYELKGKVLSVRGRKLARWVAGVLGLLALLLLLLASPLALLAIQDSTDQWELLGWIGQSYGWTSAALSGIAFLGIAASLILQSREATANREQNERNLHQSLRPPELTEGHVR